MRRPDPLPRPDLDALDEALRGKRRRSRLSPRQRLTRNLMLFLLGMFIVIIPCATPYCRPYLVSGEAMYPTLKPGDRVLTYRRDPQSHALPARNSILLAQMASGSGEFVARRVVGIPGDKLEVRDGRLWRNDKMADEPWVIERIGYTWGPITCPAGAVILLGDNRNRAEDCHTWRDPAPDGQAVPLTSVPLDRIRARVYARIYPPNTAGRLR